MKRFKARQYSGMLNAFFHHRLEAPCAMVTIAHGGLKLMKRKKAKCLMPDA
jgi:hypothetical protein